MNHPHRSFGTPDNVEYVDRPGAYILPVHHRRIAVVRTPKGYFFLGGGIDSGESHEETICRECLEEVGCLAEVGEFLCSADAYTVHHGNEPYHPVQYYYLGSISAPLQPPAEEDHTLVWMDLENLRGKMFSVMQNWALEILISNTAAYKQEIL